MVQIMCQRDFTRRYISAFKRLKSSLYSHFYGKVRLQRIRSMGIFDSISSMRAHKELNQNNLKLPPKWFNEVIIF